MERCLLWSYFYAKNCFVKTSLLLKQFQQETRQSCFITWRRIQQQKSDWWMCLNKSMICAQFLTITWHFFCPPNKELLSPKYENWSYFICLFVCLPPLQFLCLGLRSQLCFTYRFASHHGSPLNFRGYRHLLWKNTAVRSHNLLMRFLSICFVYSRQNLWLFFFQFSCSQQDNTILSRIPGHTF